MRRRRRWRWCRRRRSIWSSRTTSPAMASATPPARSRSRLLFFLVLGRIDSCLSPCDEILVSARNFGFVAGWMDSLLFEFFFNFYLGWWNFGLWLVQVVRHLIAAGHDVHVVTGAPEFVFTTEISSPNLHIRKVLLDCGAVQADALTVDRLASLEKVPETYSNISTLLPATATTSTTLALAVLCFACGFVADWVIVWCGMQYHQTAVMPRESILRTEVEWLNTIKADLVVMLLRMLTPTTCSIFLICFYPGSPWIFTASEANVVLLVFGQVSDVVPVACRAAADAGIRSVCVTNFRLVFLWLLHARGQKEQWGCRVSFRIISYSLCGFPYYSKFMLTFCLGLYVSSVHSCYSYLTFICFAC